MFSLKNYTTYDSPVDCPVDNGIFFIKRIKWPCVRTPANPSSTVVPIGIKRTVGYVHEGAWGSRPIGPCKNSIINGVESSLECCLDENSVIVSLYH